jgi:hypothetical protein
MDEITTVQIPVQPDTARALTDAHRRVAGGQLIVRNVRPARGDDPLAVVLRATARAAQESGLTDADVDAELATYNAERRQGSRSPNGPSITGRTLLRCRMSETVDLTLLSGGLQGLEREARLMRLQLDQLAGTMPVRLDSIDARLGVLEKTVHDLTSEISRESGLVRQQLTRHEKQFDVLGAGLASLQTQVAESTERLLSAIEGAGRP